MREKELMELEKNPDRKTEEQEAARKKAAEQLMQGILAGEEGADELLWQVILTFQGELFYTSSGLPFSYTVKRKKNGEYSGELEISRKEGSKTLTRSSVLLAFRRVQENIPLEAKRGEGDPEEVFIPPSYKGPKAIGQIFGISYIYSVFWRIGLIRVPPKVEARLRGSKSGETVCGKQENLS